VGKTMRPEIIDSVGIEVEFSSFSREDRRIQKLLGRNLPGYKQVHDASCETPVTMFANTGLIIDFENDEDFKALQPVCRPAIIGGEIVSPIRNSCGPEWVKEIHKLCQTLWDLGETEDSTRDSLHIHVNVSQEVPFFVLQNLLRLTATFEAILYRLGGMGRINRGVENSYCYMRPFLGNGPPIIQQIWNNKAISIPILSFEDLMAAKTREEFFDRYGDARYHASNKNRYVVERYMCVNFYPILTQGSFEFRTANKTLRPEYILAWTNFCKALIEKAYSTRDAASFEDCQRPLYENREIPTEEFLHALSYLPILDVDTIEILSEIWEKSPTPEFDNIPRLTHLENYPTYSGRYTSYCPKRVPDNVEIEPAQFIDVHRLNRQQRREWDMPPIIPEPENEPLLVTINARGARFRADNIPVEDITEDWWIEYNGHENVLLAVKRDNQQHDLLQITAVIFDEMGNDEELKGTMNLQGIYYIDMVYMVEQIIVHGIHPRALAPNPEVI